MHNQVKTLLVFPPASDPAHPPLGLASLAGYLRSRGRSVDLFDLNLFAYQSFLSPEYLAQCRQRVEARFDELSRAPELAPPAAAEYRLLAQQVLFAEHVLAEAPRALHALRDQQTYESRDAYARMATLVRRGMELVSAAHYPTRWHPRGLSMGYLPTRSSDLLLAVRDRRRNPIVGLAEQYAEQLVSDPPTVLGVSINYYCQLIPGLTLVDVLRARLPSCTVVAGGSLWGFFEGFWGSLRPLAGLLDVIIPREGERPFEQLLAAIEEGLSLEGQPGWLLSARGFLPTGDFLPPVPFEELPPPDFSGLPLDQYLSPRLLLPYRTSRGCYYARCAFCAHASKGRRSFRKKAAAQVTAELTELGERHGAKRFYFTDEAIPKDVALGVARHVAQTGGDVQWFVEARLEPHLDEETIALLARGGCKMLMFGLESGHQRVLDLMDKGIRTEDAQAILERCRHNGIRTFVMFFLGFPGELREEAEATLEFVERQRGNITHAAFTNFLLERLSPIYLDSERYGITQAIFSPDEDLKISMNHQSVRGLSQREASELVEESKQRAGVSSLVSFFVISRSHLPFLPHREEAEALPERMGHERLDEDTRLRLIDDVRVGETAFDLEEIRRVLAEADGTPSTLLPRRSKYLVIPRREQLIKVDEAGLALLGMCNGQTPLAEVLDAVGAQNREDVGDFYRQILSRGVVEIAR